MIPCAVEQRARAAGARRIAGLDEVGRGPLAGPVVAAAVVFEGAHPEGLRDSKTLSSAQRATLEAVIKEHGIWAIGMADTAEIDQLNIRRASLLAMERAVLALPLGPDHLLIDGRDTLTGINLPQDAIIRGDATSPAIAAASILAKNARDRMMQALAADHPGYGWERNMGYPTAEHRAALIRLGPTSAHRMSFRPVREAAQMA